MSLKRLNLNDLSSILDETIQKGFELEDKVIKRNDELRKGLSHNPFKPHDMNDDSPYYNPYKMGDTGWHPYEAQYWYDRGKKPEQDNYATVNQFYGKEILATGIDETINRFAALTKSVTNDLLFKGGAVAVGTVHTYTDGLKYKKVQEGKWLPVAANEQRGMMHARLQDPKEGPGASAALDFHAGQKSKIEGHLKEKQQEERVTHQATSQAMDHVHETLKKIYGDKMPNKAKHAVNENAEKLAATHPDKKRLEKLGEQMETKGHDVEILVEVGGKQIPHKFTNVQGKDKKEVKTKVEEELKKLLPAAKISTLKVKEVEQPKVEVGAQP